MLKKAGLNVGIAGNVGDSFALQVANESHDFYVLELSSFQLDGIDNFKPHIAILLNITQDHLDRYDNKMENYIQSKMRITMNQTSEDFLIYCSDDKIITINLKTQAQCLPFSISENQEQGAYLNNDEIEININQESFNMNIQQLALQGKHNIYNSMAALFQLGF